MHSTAECSSQIKSDVEQQLQPETPVNTNNGDNQIFNGMTMSAPAPSCVVRSPISKSSSTPNQTNQLNANGIERRQQSLTSPTTTNIGGSTPTTTGSNSRRNLFNVKPPQPEVRSVSFAKEGSMGIKLIGGNQVGIFVTSIQSGSCAELHGLRQGDKILKVNTMDMKGVSREEALLYLMGEHVQLNFVVQQCTEEFERVLVSQQGDSFHVRANFTRKTSLPDQLSFTVGDILHVQDSLYAGQLGTWFAQLLDDQLNPIARGCIPSERRAQADRQMELQNGINSSSSTSTSGSKSSTLFAGSSLVAQCRAGFFRRRRSARRSKSLGKEQWEELMNGAGGEPGVLAPGQPAYQRVQHKHPGFIRPIVILGAMADVGRQKLLTDYPDKYAAPMRSRSNIGQSSKKMSSSSSSNSMLVETLGLGSAGVEEPEAVRMMRKKHLAEQEDEEDDGHANQSHFGHPHNNSSVWTSSNAMIGSDNDVLPTNNDGGGGKSSSEDQNCAVIRLSSIRAISEQGKHALLDVMGDL